MSTEHFLKVEGLTKRYGDSVVFYSVNFGIRAGEFVCIIGHSGCGKTTILNVLAGLESASEGHVYLQPPAEPQQAEPVWVRPDQLQKARQGRFLCALGSTQLAADMVPLYLRPDPQVQRLRDALRVILEADWTSDRIRNIARKALEGGA